MKNIKNPKKKELIKKVMHDPALINIGKNGITDQVIVEIKLQLKKNKIIKLKFLKAVIEDHDIKDLSNEILEKTQSILIDSRGHNIILSKK